MTIDSEPPAHHAAGPPDEAVLAAVATGIATTGDQRARALLQASGESAMLLDRHGIVLAANDACAARLGVAAEDIIGRDAFGLFAADVATARRARFAHVVATGEAVTFEDRRDAYVFLVTLQPSFDASGAVSAVAMLGRDVTRERVAEAALRLQAAALEAAGNGIAIVDAGGSIVWVNRSFTEITGYTAEESIGQNPRLLKSGVHDAAFYRGLWTTVKAGRVWRGETVNRRKDGSVYTEEQTITPVQSPTGEITHFVAVKQDVTERQRVAHAVQASEQHFRALIENALDITVVLDHAGRYRYVSPSVRAILGEDPETLLGQVAFDRLHPDDYPVVLRLFSAGARVPGFVASAEYRVRHRDGSWRSFEGVGRNLLDDPVMQGIIINARDVTDRKQTEERQQQLQAQLAQSEKLAAMGQLLAGVAHELNNPLSVVIGHTTLLKTSPDARVAARAQKIEQAASRCGRIVKNFLALARQRAPERQLVAVDTVVHDALELVAYSLRVDGVEVTLDLADDTPALAADPHQLQQVLINLFTNAHHAMRQVPEPRRLRVMSRATASHPGVRLEIEDNGPGIPTDVRNRLFEPFFTTKPVGQGTGLGLSLCKGIVESHGGRIELATSAVRGARFVIELPAGDLAHLAPAEADHAVAAPTGAILIVDDEPEVARVAADMLRGGGARVVTVTNGREALTALAHEPFDVVVTDIKMPELDGMDLYREIAGRHAALSSRVVFMSGDTLNPGTTRFLETAGRISVQKPFGVMELRAAVARAVAGPPAGQAVTPTV